MTLFFAGWAALIAVLVAFGFRSAQVRNAELDLDIGEWLEARRTAANPEASAAERFLARQHLGRYMLDDRHFDRMLETINHDLGTRQQKLDELRIMREQGHGQ